MKEIRVHKGLLWLVMAVVLLSFFYAVPVTVKGVGEVFADARGVCAEHEAADVPGFTGAALSNTVTLGGAAGRPEACPRSISAARSVLNEIAMREHQEPRILQVRFWAVMSLMFLSVCVICRILIRRFGCRMIELWQNIYYIHQVDGKKGKRLFGCCIGR